MDQWNLNRMSLLVKTEKPFLPEREREKPSCTAALKGHSPIPQCNYAARAQSSHDGKKRWLVYYQQITSVHQRLDKEDGSFNSIVDAQVHDSNILQFVIVNLQLTSQIPLTRSIIYEGCGEQKCLGKASRARVLKLITTLENEGSLFGQTCHFFIMLKFYG